MSRRKKISKRRWKARCRLGQPIPKEAVVEHRLDKWFDFTLRDMNSDFAIPRSRESYDDGRLEQGARAGR
jgi:hypothetical protein